MKRIAVAALLVLGAATPWDAWAQRPNTVLKETCAGPAPPPPALAAWSQPKDLSAARGPDGLAAAPLVPGQAINAGLFPVEQVQYRVPPAKADGPQVYGGLYRLTIAEAGVYRVAAGAGPWMDLFPGQSSTPVTSIAHGHGPACSGVGKMVDFALQPGEYLVQFSESLAPKTEILVARLPTP